MCRPSSPSRCSGASGSTGEAQARLIWADTGLTGAQKGTQGDSTSGNRLTQEPQGTGGTRPSAWTPPPCAHLLHSGSPKALDSVHLCSQQNSLLPESSRQGQNIAVVGQARSRVDPCPVTMARRRLATAWPNVGHIPGHSQVTPRNRE